MYRPLQLSCSLMNNTQLLITLLLMNIAIYSCYSKTENSSESLGLTIAKKKEKIDFLPPFFAISIKKTYLFSLNPKESS